jgi:hypothetical protein
MAKNKRKKSLEDLDNHIDFREPPDSYDSGPLLTNDDELPPFQIDDDEFPGTPGYRFDDDFEDGDDTHLG